jgi:hypothetical protein
MFEDKEKLKLAEAERKAAQKLKDEGKTLLNSINIPLAKFEADHTELQAYDKTHVLLNCMKKIVDTGRCYKAQSVGAMNGGCAVSCTKDQLKEWLSQVRINSKAAQAFAKSEAKQKAKK